MCLYCQRRPITTLKNLIKLIYSFTQTLGRSETVHKEDKDYNQLNNALIRK